MTTKIEIGDLVKILSSDIIGEVLIKKKQGNIIWYGINTGGWTRYYIKSELKKLIKGRDNNA